MTRFVGLRWMNKRATFRGAKFDESDETYMLCESGNELFLWLTAEQVDQIVSEVARLQAEREEAAAARALLSDVGADSPSTREEEASDVRSVVDESGRASGLDNSRADVQERAS